MKKISLTLMVVGLFGLFACQKVDKTTLSSNPQAAVLNLQQGAVIVLLAADKDVPVQYTWTAADYGPQLVITYTLQLDKQGNNFADPLSLGAVTNATSLTILTGELNNKLLAFLPDPSDPQPIQLEFRVMTGVNPNVNPVYSAVIQQTITPFYVPIVYPLLNVPGNYQGWDPADSTTAIASVKSNDKYEGYLMFPNDTEYKYAKGSWATNWGDNDGDGTLEPDGANILCPIGGYYKLNVDLVALTHTFVRTEWGVIGSATPGGWDTDTDMTWDEDTKTWVVTMELTAAEIKFRANDAWTINYGDNEGNGTLQQDGANIPIAAAGNYTITLDLSKPIYKYKLKLN